MYRLAAVVVLLLACGRAFAAPLSIEPVWNGQFRPGVATEVIVRTAQGVAVDLTLFDTATAAVLYEHRSAPPDAVIHLPLLRPASGRIQLRAKRGRDTIATLDRQLQPLPPEARHVVIVGSGTEPDIPDASETTYVSPRSMPVFPESFSAVDALFITAPAYDRLSLQQRRALEAFAPGCGHLVEHCTPGSPLPGQAQLSALLEPTDDSTLVRMIALIFAYLAAATLLAIKGARPVPFTALTMATSVVALLSWYGDSVGTVRQVRWMELDSGAATGAYASLARLQGRSLGDHIVGRFDASSLPLPVSDESSLLLSADGTLHIRTRLLEPVHFMVRGTFAAAEVLALELAAGQPVVTNPATTPSLPALLTFGDRKFLVPALAPGDRWQPDDGAARTWNTAPAERLFRSRSRSRAAAVLMTPPPSPAGAGTTVLMVSL